VFGGGFPEVYDPAVVLAENALAANTTYWFEVYVATTDGRTATKRVVVIPVEAGSVSSYA
jgi:hypothetical protein